MSTLRRRFDNERKICNEYVSKILDLPKMEPRKAAGILCLSTTLTLSSWTEELQFRHQHLGTDDHHLHYPARWMTRAVRSSSSLSPTRAKSRPLIFSWSSLSDVNKCCSTIPILARFLSSARETSMTSSNAWDESRKSAVAYLTAPNGNVIQSNLITSRSQVAPIKPISIPICSWNRKPCWPFNWRYDKWCSWEI